MARTRVRAAARKLAVALERQELDQADEVAVGVRLVAKQIQANVRPGSLYWFAPLQYVCEQMALRVCKTHELPPARCDDVAAYLLAGMNEYVVALASEFDGEHFEAWTAALTHAENG